MTSLILAGLIAVAIIGLALLLRGRNTDSEVVLCKDFGLNPNDYQVLSSDLGGKKTKVWLRADGVVGVPDAIIQHRRNKNIIIGEAKSRHFRGKIKPQERYQVTLYMGVTTKRYRKPTSGLLRYGCGTVVPLDPDPNTYEYLIALLPKYRKVAKAIGLSSKKRKKC